MVADKDTLLATKQLVTRCIELYTKGGLVQYGLTEEQSLKIVSDLTGLSKESLIEMKKKYVDSVISSYDKAFNEVIGSGALTGNGPSY